MKLYQLHILDVGADVIYGDRDEFFPSLRAAMARRRELVAEHRGERIDDFEIERIEIPDLPRKRLALLLLNRVRYVTKREIVVEAYQQEATTRLCPECFGDGHIGLDYCDRCDGEGRIEITEE